MTGPERCNYVGQERKERTALLLLAPPHGAAAVAMLEALAQSDDSVLLVGDVAPWAAAAFARSFYEALADRYPVDAALAEAREALSMDTASTAWVAPVLFLRAPDGQIFAPADAQTPPIPTPPAPLWAPPEPARPPLADDFVGRTQELAAYGHQLDATGIALITGAHGIGKTQLAAALARQLASTGPVPGTTTHVFWHSFRADHGVETLLRALAGFLAYHGQRGLWQELEAAWQSGRQPPLDQQIDYALRLLRESVARGDPPAVLCLDEPHLVDDDAQVQQLLEQLLALAEDGALRLIIAAPPGVSGVCRGYAAGRAEPRRHPALAGSSGQHAGTRAGTHAARANGRCAAVSAACERGAAPQRYAGSAHRPTDRGAADCPLFAQRGRSWPECGGACGDGRGGRAAGSARNAPRRGGGARRRGCALAAE